MDNAVYNSELWILPWIMHGAADKADIAVDIVISNPLL